MEFVQGGDLSRYIGDPVIRSEAKEITKQLLLGLVVMHERLICHRDIKPKVYISYLPSDVASFNQGS